MPRAKRICPKPGCPKVVAKRYCTEHEREYEAKRGTPEQRGYGSAHRKLRERWRRRVDGGGVICPTCGHPIHPDAPFDLGHNDDRTAYIGAQHPACNRSDGGKRAHQTGA